MCTNARNVKQNQKKNQSVETDVEMTEIMELSHRSIKVIEYVQYGQECMKHMNLMKRKMEDRKDIKRTIWEFQRSKIQQLK